MVALMNSDTDTGSAKGFGPYGIARFCTAIAGIPPATLDENSGRSAKLKATLYAMATLGNWKTGIVECSIDRLARAAGTTRTRTLQADLLPRLADLDLIEKLRASKGGRGQVNRWQLNLDRLRALAASDREAEENPGARDRVTDLDDDENHGARAEETPAQTRETPATAPENPGARATRSGTLRKDQNHPLMTEAASPQVGEAEGDFFSELGKTDPPTWEDAEDKLRERGVSYASKAIDLAKGHGWQPIDLADLTDDEELRGKPQLLYARIRDNAKATKPGPLHRELLAAEWFTERAAQPYRDRANRLDADLDAMAGHLARSLQIDEARQAAAFILTTSETGEPPKLADLLSQAGAWLRDPPAMRKYRIEKAKRDCESRSGSRVSSMTGRHYAKQLIARANAYLLDLTLEWPKRTGPQSPRETRESAGTGSEPTEAQNAADGQHGDDERLDAIKAELQADADRRIERARHLLDLAAATLIEDGLAEREARNTAATLYGLGLRAIDGEAEAETRERVSAFRRDMPTGIYRVRDSIETHRKQTRQRARDQARDDHLASFPPTREELLTGDWATINGLADYATEQETRVLDAGDEWLREWAATQPKPEPTEPAGSTEGSDPTEGQGAPDDAETAPAVDPRAEEKRHLEALRQRIESGEFRPPTRTGRGEGGLETSGIDRAGPAP